MKTPQVLGFAPFEFDLTAGVLRRNGVLVRLQEKPLRLLEMLLSRPGQLITRAELHKALWPEQEFGEFDLGLNTVVRKLREALEDDARQPRCIATAPKRGYRWIAPLQIVAAAEWEGTPDAAPPNAAAAAPPAGAAPADSASLPAPGGRPRRARRWWWAVAGAVVVVAGGAALLLRFRPQLFPAPRSEVLLLPVANTTGDARLGPALDTALAVSLEQSSRWVLFPRSRVPSQLRLLGRPGSATLTPSLGRQICRREGLAALIVPAITRTGIEYALTAEVMDPASGEVLVSHLVRADGRDHILDALGVLAGDLRRDGRGPLLAARRRHQQLPEVTTPSLTALQDYADGVTEWRSGHAAAAIALYHGALVADPNFAMVHAALAHAECSDVNGNAAACRAEYARALAHPGRLTARERILIQARRADDLGQVESAALLYRNYLRAFPRDAEALGDYARLLRTHGRPKLAIPIYRRLLRVAPNDARTEIEMAMAQRASGDLSASLASYRTALRLDPSRELDGATNRAYGFTLLSAGHPRRAAAVFSALLRVPALRSSGLVSLARLDYWQGRLSRAKARMDQALRSPVPGNALTTARREVLLAQLAFARGDRAGGMRELRASLRRFAAIGPKVFWGAMVGIEFARAGDPGDAARLLARITPLVHRRNHQEQGYLRVLRGEVAAAQGRNAPALAILGVPHPDDGSAVVSLAAVARAHAARQAGELPPAIRWYRQVIAPASGLIGWEPQPRKQAAYLELARSELALGHRAAARAALAPLLSLLAGADSDFLLRRQALALAAQLH